MKKLLAPIAALTLASTSVLAGGDWGGSCEYGSKIGYIAGKAVLFVIGSFVFSYIFWGTKKCMASCCGSEKSESKPKHKKKR